MHAFHGIAWLGTGTVAAQLFRFARNIILTRLLAPEAFGLMAIVLSVSSTVDMFAEIGIKEAVIQNARGHEREYVNSAWWLSFCRSLLIYALLFFGAPYIAKFYRNAELTSLMRTALLGVIFIGAMSSRAFVALKLMDFKKWSIIQCGGNIGGTVMAVVLTYFLRSVWALAIAYAAECAIFSILSYIVCPFRPRFELDHHSARDLLRFSRGVFGLSFLNLLFARADVFVLGRIVSANQLGIYTIAIYLAQVPSSFVLTLLGQMLLPMYSRLQEDSARVNRILLQVTSLILALFMPVFMFVVLSGRATLSLLYGTRYGVGSTVLLLAALVAFINVVNGQITTVLYAAGRPQLHRRCVALMAAVMIVLVYPAVLHFGTAGAQVASLVAVIAGYGWQLRQISRLTGFNSVSHVKRFALPGIVFGGLLAITAGVRHSLEFTSPIPDLIFGMTASLLALGLGTLVFARARRSIRIATI